MTKVVRVYLIIEQKDKNGDIVEYTKIYKNKQIALGFAEINSYN